MIILAIETSCDETAIAIIKTSSGRRSFNVLSNIVLSQIPLHAKWGGVVPNLAKREHEKNLVPLLLQALKEASSNESKIVNRALRKKNKKHNSILEKNNTLRTLFIKYILPLPRPTIHSIAVTQGPGLEPALWVGVNFARALSALWNIPLVGINHMEGHIFSALLKTEKTNLKLQTKNKKFPAPRTYCLEPVRYPAVALLVSGGHTELVLIKKPGNYEIIGETRDDAAGEAFDKAARILKLGYPGGPQISAQAERAQKNTERNEKLSLPRPMINSKDFDFSFSGLKTAVLYLARDLGPRQTKKLRPAICKEFQDAVVEVLVKKTIRAARQHKAKTILLGGGVAANKELRKHLYEKIEQELPNAYCLVPNVSVTGDNALMIGMAAIARIKQARKTAWKTIKPSGTMRL